MKKTKNPAAVQNASASAPAAKAKVGVKAPPVLLGSKTSFKDRLRSARNEYGYLGYAALIPAIIFFLIYLARGIYPFGSSTVLVLDLNAQYSYFFQYLREAVYSGDVGLLYSWSRSLGGEFMGMYAYYLASPLSYIVCLFPETMMQEALFVIYLIKSALCGLTMGFYLHKHSENRNKITVVVFSVLYATSAYCIVQMMNLMWIDAVIWLPLLTLGIEELVKFGKYKLFVTSLALTLMSNYYIGYMCCIYTALYFFFYMIAFKDKHANDPRYENKHFLKSLVRIIAFSALAIAISAVIILTAYYSLSFGKDEFSSPDWEVSLRFNFFDLLFKFLPGSYDTVDRAGFPFVYCGVLTLLLAPLFFCSKKFSAREKVASGAFILILVFSHMISVLDLIWHGFQAPNWLNARFSFMLCFFLIVIAFRAFDNIEEISAKSVACVSAFIFFFVIMLQQFSEQYEKKLHELSGGNDELVIHEFATIILTVVCLFAYVSVIAFMKSAKKRELVSTVLLCLVCIEVFLSGLSNVNDLDEDVTFTRHYKYSEFQQLMLPVTDTVQDSDTSFYRMEKTLHRKLNDNMMLTIRGLSNSTSTLNKDTIYFLRMMGYSSSSHKSQYLGGNPVSDSLLGIKYIITDRDYSEFYGDPAFTGEDFAKHEGLTLDELIEATFADETKKSSSDPYGQMSSNDLVVYKNPYVLSLAFVADLDVLGFDMKEFNDNVDEDDEAYNLSGYASPFTRLNALVTALLGEEETVEIFKPATQNGDPVTSGCSATVSSGHNKYKNTGSADGTVTYSYTVPENTELYLYFPAYYSREVKISSSTQKILDGSETFKAGSSGKIVDLGQIDGTEYKLTVTISSNDDLFYTRETETSFIYYIDTEALEDAFAKLQSKQLVIDEDYEEDDITGTITTDSANQLVLTTIPYDEGWKIYVDGEQVKTVEALDALIAFTVDSAGNHTVRMKYSPSAFNYGLAITVIASAAFLLIMIFEKRLAKIKLIKAIFVVEDNAPAIPEETPSDGESGSSQGESKDKKTE